MRYRSMNSVLNRLAGSASANRRRTALWGGAKGAIRPANLAVIAILVLWPMAVFTYRLRENPPGFFIDEAIYGYEAHTVLKTGGFSSSGEFLPRLFDHGYAAWGHGVYTYLVAVFVGILGLSEFSVRLTSAVVSTALLCALYGLLRDRVSRLSLLLAALWWPLTSWVFLLSRIGMEMIAFALVSILLLWVLIRMQEAEPGTQRAVSARHILLFDLLLVTIFFLYAGGKVMALGTMLFALVILARRRVAPRHFLGLLVAPAIILLLSIPYIVDGTFLYRTDELFRKCGDSVVRCLAVNLASHFSYRSYFGNTYIPPDWKIPTHSITGTSLIPRPLAAFLLIGILVWLRRAAKKDALATAMPAVVFLGIVPASLTVRGFDSYRSVVVLPILFIVIALGLDSCVRVLGKVGPRVPAFFMAGLLAGTIWFGYHEAKHLRGYEYVERVAIDWHYGYPAILDYFIGHYDEYEELMVTKSVAYVPDLYIRFYDPEGGLDIT